MGHRALVAYERDGGLYDVHYSHWGGADLRLGHAIAAGRRFGEEPDGPTVDPAPIATGLAFEDVIIRCVDFLVHEAVYVVGADGSVTAYRVCWFGVYTADGVVEGDPVVGRGALLSVSIDDPRDDGYVTGWFDGVRAVTGDLIDRRGLAERDLVPYLVDLLERFAGDDRTLVVDPTREGR